MFRCPALTAWTMSPNTAVTSSLSGAQSQNSGQQTTTHPTATTFSTCTQTSWSSTTFGSKSLLFLLSVKREQFEKQVEKRNIRRPSTTAAMSVNRRICVLQGAWTEHLPVPSPLWRSRINHSFGLCLSHVWQHLTRTQPEEGALASSSSFRRMYFLGGESESLKKKMRTFKKKKIK